MSKVILVTGATGTVGSHVLAELAGRAARKDLNLRAAVRDLSKFALVPGADPVLFDYAKPETFPGALNGVDSVFMVAPFTPDGVEQAKAFIKAAKTAGVKQIVKLSVIRSVSEITVGRWHAAIDQALKDSGIAWTILLPGGFMQNFLEGSAPRPDGTMCLPVGDAKAAFIDVPDIAAVAAKALTETGHEGKEYTLTGPAAISHAEVAAEISKAAGRQIRFVDVPEEAAKKAMLDAHMPPWLVDVLVELSAWTKANGGAQVTNTVSELLGRPARTFAQFAKDNADHWK